MFAPAVVQSLNGIAWWAVMLFVMIAGVELDLMQAWRLRRESSITAGLALGTPLVFGRAAATALLLMAVVSTMLTMPMVVPKLVRLHWSGHSSE